MEHDTTMHSGTTGLIGVGDLWRKSYSLFGKSGKKIVSLALPVTAIFLLLSAVIQLDLLLSDSLTLAPYIVLQVILIILTTTFFIATLFYPGVLISALLLPAHSHDNSFAYNTYMKERYAETAGKFGSFVWITILAGVMALSGYILFIFPGIFIQIMLMFSIVILFAENKVGLQALAQSWHYVRGHWWAVFGRVFLVAFLAAVVGGIFQLIVSPLSQVIMQGPELANILTQLFQFFVLLPFVLIYIVTLYTSLSSLKSQSLSDHEVYRTKQIFGWILLIAVVFTPFIFSVAERIYRRVNPNSYYTYQYEYNKKFFNVSN